MTMSGGVGIMGVKIGIGMFRSMLTQVKKDLESVEMRQARFSMAYQFILYPLLVWIWAWAQARGTIPKDLPSPPPCQQMPSG